MNRMYFAGFAIAATVAATPLLAQPQPGGNPPANAAANPSTTAPPGEANQPGGASPMGMGPGMWQGGPGAMPWRMMERSPGAWCVERLARRAALRAYVGAKLDLTAEQRPLWQKVQDAASAEAQKERQLCDTMKPRASATVLDRLDRMQQFLSARLAGLTALKPALEALYNSLTSEQKQVIDDPFRSGAYAAAGAGPDSGGDPGWGGGGGGHPGGGGGHPGGGAWGGHPGGGAWGGHPGGAWAGGGYPGGAWGGHYYGWGGRYYGWRRPYYGWGWGWGLGAALAYPYYYGYPYDYCYGYNYPFGYCYPYGYSY